MSQERNQERKWNIFARELDTLLAVRGLALGHLDDRAHIHREKVRRLRRGLREPKFHVLPPAELDHVCDVFGFSQAERLLLRAAVLCTAIEELLMDRINQDDALAAAEQLFPLLCRAVAAHDGDDTGIGAIKGGVLAVLSTAASPPDNGETANPEEDEQALEASLEYLDSAVLALHFASSAKARPARMRHARLAHSQCMAALAALDLVPAPVKGNHVWRLWHADVLSTLAAAEQILAANAP